ncbi:hypothetical protein OG590_02820 [Streptomyces goshikiensis]|uniref:hypothetical protein n=1 Tax=Streptomyces TaxID=1883 RepID=UPI000563572B|nr:MULTISPECIES: hypothetical protein [Streptomyces]AKL69283.1 membrane protein [Streptomyces sp. Mg1]RPK32767.1 hypothetical protein EES37_32255 [Streptomyces sp. ADI91-18]WBY23626.1 hypothetical protein PET44_30580 [Streptomyces goshikiensis]WSS02535.1 hypothetical protein OG224_33200 [Streptomyces goshikiensis]WSX96239.1 hypothetical protein OG590_02820 [Streptomyces goshikiensis]
MAHDEPPGADGADEALEDDPRFAAARLKERLYASITMISVVIGLAAAEHADAVGAAATVLTAAVGLWLAALVADQQAHRVVHGRLATGHELRAMLAVSSPLLVSAAGPLVLIGAAALGVMELDTALLTAAGVNVATLFAWGCFGGIRMGGGTVSALLAGALDAAIGTAVALVKAAAGH